MRCLLSSDPDPYVATGTASATCRPETGNEVVPLQNSMQAL
jgi:hypothetical protein